MSRLACHSPLLEPIEHLLRRISRRALSDQLSVGKALPARDVVAGEPVCAGRRPAGLVSLGTEPRTSTSKLGEYLARTAHLEAASVIAFERLAEELSLHKAPAQLVERALSAREDEQRHAAVMRDLALARGGQPEVVRTREFRPRGVLELAVENAVEGCIRETYGALVGAHQATRAKDLELRMAFRGIAPDEARHAALAHAVHVWAWERLDPSARERLRKAQLAAVFELARECSLAPDAELLEAAGLPDAAMACALLGELTRELWLGRAQKAA